MMNKKILVCAGMISLSQISSINAQEVDPEQLVGNFYGGIHGAFLDGDNDREGLKRNELKHGYGFGLEAGYRLSSPLELRLSYTRFKATEDSAESVNRFSFDTLFFPTEKSIYFVGGLNSLDFYDSTDVGINLGAGYRHYFTTQLATYAEGKVNYQFDDSYFDGIAQIGLIYFFGAQSNNSPEPNETSSSTSEPSPASATPPMQEKTEQEVVNKPTELVAVTPIDTDKDGVEDKNDQCPATPVEDKVDEVGCTVFAEKSLSYRLSIEFDSGQSDVKEQYFEELDKVAEFFKTYPHINATIDGYSSIVGNAEYNKTLSQQRADAVMDILINKYGISADRLTAIGHGETNLIDSSNTPSAHKKNRRIEINVEDTHKQAVSR